MIRMSIALSQEDQWIVQAISELQRSFDEKGLPVSKSAIVRMILKKGLEVFKEHEPGPDDNISGDGPLVD